MNSEKSLTVSKAIVHESAHKHVTGEAIYTDDIPILPGTLHAHIVMSKKAHARIKSINLSKALALPGVICAITAKDIPGKNEVGPIFPGEPALVDETAQYVGDPIAAIAAVDEKTARIAAEQVVVEYEELEPVLSIEKALEKDWRIGAIHTLKLGESKNALEQSPNRVKGELKIGGQDHFYLEGQIAYAIPKEDGDIHVYSSTQHPSEVQKMVAQFLGIPRHSVVCEVRRMGGGFGGKETQPAIFACIASLLARKTTRPVKLRLCRDDDMIMTGKRHDFLVQYEAGFDQDGKIQAVEMQFAARCGHVADLSTSIVDRALFHADNCYFLSNATLKGIPCKTNTVSNTAFRGFGGPQGMLAIEHVMDHIATYLKMEPVVLRQLNYYGTKDRNITPYHQVLEDNIMPRITDELLASSEYYQRKAAIRQYNQTSPYLKRGIAFTPVKFGISFTTSFLNQAGALLHVYADGSIQINHGGTEMGQGLYTKVAQIVAEEFQVDFNRVKVTATVTDKVPNTSATAASSGTDLNGMAALMAARSVKERLIDFAVSHYGVNKDEVVFHRGKVTVGDRRVSFEELVNAAHHARVGLSSTGFYSTPKIHYDRQKAQGHPFYYFAYGAAVSEVVVDAFSGDVRFLRSDLLHDVGDSINPAVDLGQVEGAFVQGLGWLTMEELYWDQSGVLKTHAPSTYKIPSVRDIPEDFRVSLLKDCPNRENTIYRSKAVGEPPLMLANSVWLAIKDAVAAFANYEKIVHLNAPATAEEILLSIQRLK